METIFDHDITNEELKKFFRQRDWVSFKEQYKISSDAANFDLYRLFLLRGEKDRAQQFLDKIEDASYKFSIAQLGDLVH